jgi:hypothetical protein
LLDASCKEVDDVKYQDDSVSKEAPSTPPEPQQTVKSKPEPVPEFLPSKGEEDAACATTAVTKLSANLNWADPAPGNDDWDSIVATTTAGNKKKKKGKKGKVRPLAYVIDTSLSTNFYDRRNQQHLLLHLLQRSQRDH